jgi:hypothetical protein
METRLDGLRTGKGGSFQKELVDDQNSRVQGFEGSREMLKTTKVQRLGQKSHQLGLERFMKSKGCVRH